MEDTPENTPLPKALYVITKGNWGGAQRYVFDLATAAKGAGFEPVVAIGGEEGLLNRRLKEAGIRVISLPQVKNDASFDALRVAYRTLKDLLREERPTIVHLNSSLVGASGALAARQVGIPRAIFTAHGWAFNEDRPLLQKILIFLVHYATAILSHQIICVSEAIRKDMRYMLFVSNKTTIIKHGLLEPNFKGREDARQKLVSGKQNYFWIGMLGELHKTKGVFEAVEAFEKIAQKLPDALLVIVGEGRAREALEKQIAQSNLKEKVVLVGHVDDGATYLKAFDIFLFPSRTEALGYALLEAGHASLPAVATAVGGIPEIIDDRKEGLLVERNNSKAIADALLYLQGNPLVRRKLGEALKEKVEKGFSLESALKKTFATYKDAQR